MDVLNFRDNHECRNCVALSRSSADLKKRLKTAHMEVIICFAYVLLLTVTVIWGKVNG